jgi:flagellar assembly protein FliH
VRLHPDDVAALVAAGTALPDGVDLAGDASLARGDAVAQYADGVLDARLAAAFARAEAALRGEVDA